MIFVHAAGAITPVGIGLADTAAAIYTKVQLFEDLGVLDSDGEPLSGMKVRLDSDMPGPDRLVAMANAVVDECTLRLGPTDKVPLILCCPEAGVFGEEDGFPARLLATVMAESTVPIDKTRSRIIAGGRDGVTEALGAALTVLKDGSVPYCLVGGVDSFVDPTRIESLIEERRLVMDSNKDGFIAGEAGAMLLLSNRSDADTMATWLAASIGSEPGPRGSEAPVTGTGIQEAINRALAQANVTMDAIACVSPDFSGEQRYFDEMLLASGRLAKQAAYETELPGLSVGETGAAAGFVSLSLLAFLHSKSVHSRPSLAVFSCDGSERGAVVLGPPPPQRR